MTGLLDFDAIAAATCKVRYELAGPTQKWHLSGPEAAVKAKVASLLRELPRYRTTVVYKPDGVMVTTFGEE